MWIFSARWLFCGSVFHSLLCVPLFCSICPIVWIKLISQAWIVSHYCLVYGSTVELCVCPLPSLCASLSAPGWGILSCCMLSKVECSGDRERERNGEWEVSGESLCQLGCCQWASPDGLDSACSRQIRQSAQPQLHRQHLFLFWVCQLSAPSKFSDFIIHTVLSRSFLLLFFLDCWGYNMQHIM